MWVLDPWTAEDIIACQSLRIPGQADVTPWGFDTDGYGMRRYADIQRRRRSHSAREILAISAPSLASKISSAYGVTPSAELITLPYPLSDDITCRRTRSATPKLTLLGRLDPIKRPWIFIELAKRFPDLAFIVIGVPNHSGTGMWTPKYLPNNVVMLGHVDGNEKYSILCESWALISASIHEGLPISFVEALYCGVPLISSQNPDFVATRFGRYVGRWDGAGLEAIAVFSDAIRDLLDDPARWAQTGAAGRAWARKNHGEGAFLASFERICEALGLEWSASGRN
jgi:glycosyltransferase involved in cell wall biosynthesis